MKRDYNAVYAASIHNDIMHGYSLYNCDYKRLCTITDNFEIRNTYDDSGKLLCAIFKNAEFYEEIQFSDN